MSRGQTFGLGAALLVAAIVALIAVSRGSSDNSKKKTVTANITVVNGKSQGGVKKITAKKGDTVSVSVTSKDAKDEVHVHATNQGKDVAPGHPVSFRFRARVVGVTEIELEHASTKLASVVIEP